MDGDREVRKDKYREKELTSLMALLLLTLLRGGGNSRLTGGLEGVLDGTFGWVLDSTFGYYRLPVSCGLGAGASLRRSPRPAVPRSPCFLRCPALGPGRPVLAGARRYREGKGGVLST
jgi:hypothetical protein